MLALCPGLAFAQSDTVRSGTASSGTAQSETDMGLNDTVYLQNAQSSLSEGNALGKLSTTTYGSPGYNQMIGDFEAYKDNMSAVVDAQADTKRVAHDFAHLLNEAGQAAKEKDVGEQNHLFGNYLYESRNFLILHPGYPEANRIWILRAVAALKLNKPATGAEAGRVIAALPPQDRDDPHIKNLLAVLDKQGWLPTSKTSAAKANPSPQPTGTPAKP